MIIDRSVNIWGLRIRSNRSGFYGYEELEWSDSTAREGRSYGEASFYWGESLRLTTVNRRLWVVVVHLVIQPLPPKKIWKTNKKMTYYVSVFHCVLTTLIPREFKLILKGLSCQERNFLWLIVKDDVAKCLIKIQDKTSNQHTTNRKQT